MVHSRERVLVTPELESLLDSGTERRQLQESLARRLFAYFDAVYEVLNVDHPSCHTPIIVWMTEDTVNPTNPFQGPIPLLFELPPDLVIYDYRELNDERAGVFIKATGELNPMIRNVLELPIDRLHALVDKIDRRMEKLADEQGRRSVAEDLKAWGGKVGYEEGSLIVRESSRHDYEEALKDLHGHYCEVLSSLSLPTT